MLGGDTVSNEVLVESDYTVNLNIFGKIDAQNMSFSELKPIVEKTITTAYPRSMPFLNIVSVGIFQVLIKGEVPQTTYVSAWGLSRLSSVIKDYLGPYSSIRDIGIISGNGTLRKYDLFKALQLGIVEEDPYIQPGDSIVVSRRDREVELKGEVYPAGQVPAAEGPGLERADQPLRPGFDEPGRYRTRPAGPLRRKAGADIISQPRQRHPTIAGAEGR